MASDSAFDLTPHFGLNWFFVTFGEIYKNHHFYFFTGAYQLHELGDPEVSPQIHIGGDTRNRLLNAYIELFNFDNAIGISNGNMMELN